MLIWSLPHLPPRVPLVSGDLFQLARAVVTKKHRAGGLNHRHVSSPRSGGWKAKIKLSAESVPSAAGRESLLQAAIRGGTKAIFSLGLCTPRLPFLCVFIQVSLLIRAPIILDWGPPS